MKKLTGEQYTKKWQTRTSAASGDYKDGVNAVDEAPTAKAADNIDKMRQNFNAAIDSGKTEAGLRSVSLADWKGAASGKGAANFATGVNAAVSKVQKIAGPLLAHIAAGVEKIRNMPTATLEEGILKSAVMIRHMAEFKKPT